MDVMAQPLRIAGVVVLLGSAASRIAADLAGINCVSSSIAMACHGDWHGRGLPQISHRF